MTTAPTSQWRIFRAPRGCMGVAVALCCVALLYSSAANALDLEKLSQSAKSSLQEGIDGMPKVVEAISQKVSDNLPFASKALALDKREGSEEGTETKSVHATVQWADDEGKLILLFRTSSEEMPKTRTHATVKMHFNNRPMLYAIKKFFCKVLLRASEPFDIIEMRQRFRTEMSGFDDTVTLPEDKKEDGEVQFHFHELHRNVDNTVYGSMLALEWFQVDNKRIYMETIRTQTDYARVTFVLSAMLGTTFSSFIHFGEPYGEKFEDVVLTYRVEYPEFAIQDLDGRLPSAANAFTLTTSVPACGVEGRQALRELWKVFPRDQRPAELFPNERRRKASQQDADVNQPYSATCKRIPLVVEFGTDDIHPLRDSLKERGEWNYPKFQAWTKMSSDTQLRRNFGNMIMYKTVKSIKLDDASLSQGDMSNNVWEKKLGRMWDGLRGTKVVEISPMDVRETVETAPAPVAEKDGDSTTATTAAPTAPAADATTAAPTGDAATAAAKSADDAASTSAGSMPDAAEPSSSSSSSSPSSVA